jgi:hypothetical protein
VTSASAADGYFFRQVVSTVNTSSEVWADSAYRSKNNEQWLSDRMMTYRIHRRKPMGKPMPRATARTNAAKSAIRAHVEHDFAYQKNRFGLFIRTIGLACAGAKLRLCNLAYNFNQLIFMNDGRAWPGLSEKWEYVVEIAPGNDRGGPKCRLATPQQGIPYRVA